MKLETRKSLVTGGLISATLIYIYPLLLPTPLLEPDEGLHATISQEMLEQDDWIVPTFRGEPFLDKPILYFWAQMISLKCLGMTEAGVRLPGLVFGLLGAVTTGVLAGRLFNRLVGLLAWLVAMTMCIPLALAQAAVHDVALVPWTNLALLCLWEMEHAPQRQKRRLWQTGAVCVFALAILTKALIGVAIVGVGFGLFLIFSRKASVGSCARLGIVAVLGTMLASPWFIAMEIRVPGYVYYYFIERHILGFATSSQRHGLLPWYYYLPYISAGSLPWIWYAIPMLRDEWHHRRMPSPSRPAMILLLCWLFGGLFFLSAAKSKLVTYALPLFPAMAILCAVAWQRFAAQKMSAVSARWFVSLIRSSAIFGTIVPWLVLLTCGILLDTAWPMKAWGLAAALSVVSGVSWSLFRQQYYYQTASVLSVWVAGLTCLAMTWPLQMFAENHSERSLAQWLNRQAVLPEHLILIGERPASVLFYLTSERRNECGPERIVAQGLDDFLSHRQLEAGTVVAVTQKKLAELDSRRSRIPGVLTESVGQFHLFHHRPQILTLARLTERSTQ